VSAENAGRKPVLVAPDSFKGTFSSPEVARAVSAGLEGAGVTAAEHPVADGGEGTLEVLLGAHGGETVEVEVRDPLGRPTRAHFALLASDRRTAVVETALAIGLGKLAASELDPLAASSHGAGELILAARRAGAQQILVATGGSATVDGGRGALEAIAAGGGLDGARITVLSDVTTPWEECAAVFGPQKGADPDGVVLLERRLDELARTLPRDPRGAPMSGSAGGISGALWAAHDAVLTSGADFVLESTGFFERVAACRAVVTGEGRLDSQSLEGKIVGRIAAGARDAGVPLFAVVGRNSLDQSAVERMGFAAVIEASTRAELEAAGAALAARL